MTQENPDQNNSNSNSPTTKTSLQPPTTAFQNLTTSDAAKAIKDQLLQKGDITLDDGQLVAVERCVDMSSGNRIVPVTGPAGTGKTTIIRVVHSILTEAGYNVVLCAPTGKAAKRIHEATGIPAQTIHRLLEYPHPGERDEKTGKALRSTDPKRNTKNPLVENIIIADEYAMVNTEVHTNLVAALRPGARLLMFGDANQLRPIESSKLQQGKPSPFETCISRFQGVALSMNHRQGKGSGVAENGKHILRGNVPKRYEDFEIRITSTPTQEIEDIVMESGINFCSIDNQIISTTKKTWVGTYKLNILMQSLLNPRQPSKKSVRLPRHKWDEKLPITLLVGDKVIWTENSYDLRDEMDRYEAVERSDDEPPMTQAEAEEHVKTRKYTPVPPSKMILNGETGIVTDISSDGDITIDVGDRIVDIPCMQLILDRQGNIVEIDPRRRIDLAYCITTHKSQGSEYSNVVYVMNKSAQFLLCRSNFYTAITRAREKAIVVADQRSLQSAVHNVIAPVEKNKR